MSIVDSLKKLVVALGGAEDAMDVPGDNVAEVIDRITERVKQLDFTDNELPPIGDDDDGKFVGVSDGAYALVSAPAASSGQE